MIQVSLHYKLQQTVNLTLKNTVQTNMKTQYNCLSHVPNSLTIIGYCSYINQFRIIFMSYIVEDKEWDISCGYVY